MAKIKSGDLVQVISGADKGKQGKVLKVLPKENRVIVEGVKVEGKVVGQIRGEKIVVYKYKSKKNYRRKQGHRQPYTKVEITKIG